MKLNTAIYWAATGCMILGAGLFSIADIIQPPFIQEMTRHLGFPLYVLPLFGSLKIAGTVCAVLPALKRFREAAYAGIFYFFLGAAYCHLANGDGLGKAVLPLGILAASVVSYILSRNKYSLSKEG